MTAVAPDSDFPDEPDVKNKPSRRGRSAVEDCTSDAPLPASHRRAGGSNVLSLMRSWPKVLFPRTCAGAKIGRCRGRRLKLEAACCRIDEGRKSTVPSHGLLDHAVSVVW